VSTSHQSAMPEVGSRSRHHELVAAPTPQRARALAKVAGLMVLTALGAAFAAGGVGLALVMALSAGGH
jgi:hypothetical protein